jgi:hypothetical protein
VKFVKIVAILLVLYISVVVAFESFLGYIQPENQNTLVITTTDNNGAASNRVLSTLESNGQLYVAANHWPRAWYTQALKNPNVQVALASETSDYLAVPIIDEEHDRVSDENRHSLGFRILTGFPPRYFIRLDPR